MAIQNVVSQMDDAIAIIFLIVILYLTLCRSTENEKTETNLPESSNGEIGNMNQNQIDNYLTQIIAKLPEQLVPNEDFKFSHIYLPMVAQKMGINNNPKLLEDWVTAWLQDEQKQDKVMFIQAPLGRGKSVFCRIFADRVRRDELSNWIPVRIELRHSPKLQVSFEDFLRDAVKKSLEAAVKEGLIQDAGKNNVDFTTTNENWLTNPNQRFLFLLDGFDEYDIQNSNVLGQLIAKIEGFQQKCQNSPDMNHRILITSRQLALQNIKPLSDKFEVVEILPMEKLLAQDKPLWEEWLDNKWQPIVGETQVLAFKEFLADSRWQEAVKELIKEPLLLYYLAAEHHLGNLTDNSLNDSTGVRTKIWIYQNCFKRVLTQQRLASLQQKITGLNSSDDLLEKLLPILAEAALCVVQSGGESASRDMLKERLGMDNNDAIKNALATFYINPSTARNERDYVKFYHHSFRDYLCAQRLKTSLEKWSQQNEWNSALDSEVYDLLGYGSLTKKNVEYLMALLDADGKFAWEPLFNNLENFYYRWCNEDIDQIIPRRKQEKMEQYQINIDQREVNVYAVLNVMILLLELHRYAESENARQQLSQTIAFYPCGKNWEADFKSSQLLNKIIAKCTLAFDENAFVEKVGQFLSSIRLSEANLMKVNLVEANLSKANLIDANLKGANLTNANLTKAYLNSIDLSSAKLINANLNKANLCAANLRDTNLNDAQLEEAYLGGVNLQNATLKNVTLSNAILCAADLNGADLSGADLSGANLMGADVSGANFRGVNLTGANITGVRGLEKARNFPQF